MSNSDQQQALKVHNDARSACPGSRPPLEWSSFLSKEAESYAAELSTQNQLSHSGVSGQGENLFMRMTTSSSTHIAEGALAAAAESWVNERDQYNGEKIGEGDLGKWGHFTQACWPETTKVGMGLAKTKDGKGVYVVARYVPQGNMMGQGIFG